MALPPSGASGSDHGIRSYRAQEGGSVTFEWLFSPPAVVAAVKIHCLALAPPKVFFHLDRRADEAPHQQFAGWVRCDRDALGTGRVRLRLSGVRAADSGLYLCRMATGSGRKATQFTLQVTGESANRKGKSERKKREKRKEREKKGKFREKCFKKRERENEKRDRKRKSREKKGEKGKLREKRERKRDMKGKEIEKERKESEKIN